MATDPKIIKNFTCFQGLSEEQIDAIAKISNSICYSAGYTLIKEGEPGDMIYLLIDGEIEVFFEHTATGVLRVDTVSSEEVIGCAAFVPPYIYTATEKCLTDVEVLEIDTDELRNLIKKDPDLGLQIQEHIIKTLNERILVLRQRAFS